jgi:hypothetical protein
MAFDFSCVRCKPWEKRPGVKQLLGEPSSMLPRDTTHSNSARSFTMKMSRIYHEDVAESLDLGDSVCHEVDAIEIGEARPRRCKIGEARPRRCIRIVPERLRCAGV